MPHVIQANSIDEPVRQFLTNLDISSEPSLIEIGGRRVYVVVRPAHPLKPAEAWTEAKAKRRHELIDRKLDATISPLEAVELAELNEEFDCYLQQAAPLPLDFARQLLDTLSTHAGRKP